jgi:hypothetical protein
LSHQGEKLNVADLAEPARPEAVLAASRFLQLAQRLPVAPPAEHFGPPAGMSYVAPGLARAGWQQNHVPIRFRADPTAGSGVEPASLTWDELDREIAPHRELLGGIQDCLAGGPLDWNLDYQLGPLLLRPHLGTQKRVAQWFMAVVSNDLHARRLDSAHQALLAQTTLARLLESDVTFISQLVGNALGALAFGSTWEAWQADGWSDLHLAQLQEAWTRTHYFKPMLRAMEMERAMGRLTFDYCRQNVSQIANVTGGLDPIFPPETPMGAFLEGLPFDGSGIVDELRLRLWRWRWSYVDELAYLELCQSDLEILRDASPLHSKLAAPELLEAGQTNLHSRILLEDLRLPTQLTLKKAAGSECLRSLAIAALALKRHHLAHGGRYPESLEQLVPRFVPEVPLDPYDAHHLRYRSEANDRFILYSVGVDGVDDGGDPAPTPCESRARFLFFGKDIVWPWPP